MTSTRSRILRLGATLMTLLLVAPAASAQNTVPPSSLQGLLSDLAGKVNSVATGIPSPPPDTSSIAVQIALEVSTAPFGTSTGGLAVTFDPSTGAATPAAQTFGPMFGQRSVTLGQGRFSVGLHMLYASYDSYGGLSLSNGDLRLVKDATGPDGTPAPAYYASVKIGLTSNMRVGFVNYGVTESLDVGIAVPWVTVSLNADVGLFTFDDVDITPGGHLLVLPAASSTGVGDIVFFGKHRFWRYRDGGLAAGLELHLPTGDTANLRGTGVWRTLVSAIWSSGGRVSPHANLGYEFWSAEIQDPTGTEVRNQINYALGLEWQAHPRLTLLGELVGRRLLGSGRLGYRQLPVGALTAEVLVPLPESLDVVSFAPGFRWNVAGDVLVTGTALATITNGGLRANLIPVFGLEWVFGR